MGRLGGSNDEASDFRSGRKLAVHGFRPASGSLLTAVSTEPGACFGFYVSLSLSLALKNKQTLKVFPYIFAIILSL